MYVACRYSLMQLITAPNVRFYFSMLPFHLILYLLLHVGESTVVLATLKKKIIGFHKGCQRIVYGRNFHLATVVRGKMQRTIIF